ESWAGGTESENGLFARQPSRGDSQIILRRAENDPYSLLFKPVRPPLEKMEAELKKQGKDFVRGKYRRRPLTKIIEEVEDECKDNFAEHQLKIETVQIMQDDLSDLSGASKPVEIKVFGREYKELRRIADELSGDKLEKLGKGRGIKGVNSNVFEGNPDLMIKVKEIIAARTGLTVDAIERQLRAMFIGQIATQVRESATRIT